MKISKTVSICLNSLIAVTLLMFAANTVFAADYKEATAKGMTFMWKINGENLDVKVKAKTEGWVAVGFNPSKAMKDANIIIGYVKGKKVTVADHFGKSEFKHQDDEKLGGKSNLTNIAGSEKNGVTEISFTIPLKSGDSKDASLDPKKDTVVMLAYGTRDSFRPKHKEHAILTVNLTTGVSKAK